MDFAAHTPATPGPSPSTARIPDGALEGTPIFHPDARRGRASISNASGRFERHQRVGTDDGWNNLDAQPSALRTQVFRDSSRTIIARNTSPDVPFDRSINPYRGCEHGCSYCFARPTHSYLGFSPGLDFESKLFAKPDAAALLEKALRMPKYNCRPMALGTNTDPYQPIEREHRITRSVLEVLARFKHPVSIVTKGALVTRDIDILADMARNNLARVYVSVTTLDHRLARKMEPRASTPTRRLEAIKALSDAGVPTGVMFAPAIPGLNDHEMDSILAAAKDSGAREAGYVTLRLPLEVKALFYEWLTNAAPERASRVMTLIRAMRRGRDYDPDWSQRMIGTGPVAETLRNRFRLASKRLGFDGDHPALDTSKFSPPLSRGGQLALF